MASFGLDSNILTMLLKAAFFLAFRRGGLRMTEEEKGGAISCAFIGDASCSIRFAGDGAGAGAGGLRMVGVARVAASSSGAAGGLRVSRGPST